MLGFRLGLGLGHALGFGFKVRVGVMVSVGLRFVGLFLDAEPALTEV